MRTKRLITLIIIMTTLCITACGNNTSQSTVETFKVNIQYNKESISTSINNVISTGDVDSNFINGFTFNAEDIIEVDNNCRTYYFDGAYYLQSGLYMYRFQLNENGLIESYIKYNLEG